METVCRMAPAMERRGPALLWLCPSRGDRKREESRQSERDDGPWDRRDESWHLERGARYSRRVFRLRPDQLIVDPSSSSVRSARSDADSRRARATRSFFESRMPKLRETLERSAHASELSLRFAQPEIAENLFPGSPRSEGVIRGVGVTGGERSLRAADALARAEADCGAVRRTKINAIANQDDNVIHQLNPRA